jgi:ABC-type uncharacterized transport system ATPase component
MCSVTNIALAQQRQKDREMLQAIQAAIKCNDEVRSRLEETQREIEKRLGDNKPDPEVA